MRAWWYSAATSPGQMCPPRFHFPDQSTKQHYLANYETLNPILTGAWPTTSPPWPTAPRL